MVYQRADNLQRVDMLVEFLYQRQRKAQQEDDKTAVTTARRRWPFVQGHG
jgi:hypothetical protein